MAERRILLACDCAGSAAIDAEALGAAVDAKAPLAETRACGALCGADLGALVAAAEGADELVVAACRQEIPTFEAALADAGAEARLRAVDIRDRAGWSRKGADATKIAAKQAALAAEALLPAAAAPIMPVVSEGVALIYAPGPEAADAALAAAERLSDALSVTLMLAPDAAPELKPGLDVVIVTGEIASAAGALGGFDLRVDRFAELARAGRGPRRFGALQDGARTRCDLILDLSARPALFPAAHKRDGYLRADPRDPVGVERALFDAVGLVGEFEKPLYVRFEAALCAHSRARKPGCDRCLTVCPTGAITPDGDHVAIDPTICAGCGACATVCPTGAARYDDPDFEHLLRRMTTLAETFRAHAGGAPRLLVHDAAHGLEMIALAARHGDGLPEDVLPLALEELGQFGHAATLAALALGFSSVDLLLGPQAERDAIRAQADLANAMAAGALQDGAARARLLEPADPDALCAALYAGDAPGPHDAAPILPMGAPREVARAATQALGAGREIAEPIDLSGVEPRSVAAYGAVLVDQEACTLCLACVGLCPTGALEDNPDRPELRFREDACIQCGICARACPETAITLAPRFNLADAARQPQTVHEEEPFACIECGALFGVKSAIERVTEKLAGVNWMYTNSDNVRLIQMCDDCRVQAQYHGEQAPFFMAERRRPRTTDDYLKDGALKDGALTDGEDEG